MTYPIALAHVRWLSREEGGRRTPPPGPVYASTAHFADEPLDRLFSVVLRFSAMPSNWEHDAELTVLAPENLPAVVARLVPGSLLTITEGSRKVAEAQVLSVRTAPGSPPPAFGNTLELGRSSQESNPS